MSIKAEAPSVVYEPEESEILTRMKNLMGGEAFHTETDTERLHIIDELRVLVQKIRNNEVKPDDFFAFQDKHFDNPKYAFLSAELPGINIVGWRVFMALMDPLQYGKTIGPPGNQSQTKWRW